MKETKFTRLYTWMVEAKSIMGLFFTALVFMYLFLGLVFGLSTGTAWASLGFFTAVEMIFASFLIGILRQIILPNGVFTKARCLLWIGAGTLDVLAFTLIFGWFANFPAWYASCFVAIIPLGMALMLLHYALERQRETKRLNAQLEKFQGRTTKE